MAADGDARSISYEALDLEARAVGARLQECTAPGERALILCEDAVDFARAFMGCQLASVVAVPVSSPFPSQRGRRVTTLRAIARDCGACTVIGAWPEGLRARVESAAPELAGLAWVAVDDVPAISARDFRADTTRPDGAAFLQYTSGSTSMPKGVVVTHDMLVHNAAYIQRALAYSREDVMVSWLPLFHDMGLIGVMLSALYCGAQAVMMPPSAFARQPLSWLAAISSHRGTITAAPDSAYRLCVDRITPDERAQLDLRSLRLACNGAEPVASATIAAFADAFATCGFRASSWFPTYGLAECTLMATGPTPGAGATVVEVDPLQLQDGRVVRAAGRRLIGCGKPAMHRRIEIVEPETARRVGPGEVGEIWIAGPDVSRGYWARSEESEQLFGARLAGEGPFLRTGDLGFLWDGELFVSGRLKDVIIVGGRNHYPQDIEATALSAHGVLIAGACVAFSIARGDREQVAIVAEVQSPRARLGVDLALAAERVRAAVAEEHGIAVAEVAFVERKSVPRTTSGKLQRGACCMAFEQGEFVHARTVAVNGEVLALGSEADRRRAVRNLVTEQLERILNSPGAIDTTIAFQELGLDSLKAAELAAQLERALGRRLSARMFYSEPTTDRLIERLVEELAPAPERVAEAS